jgi:hypothetical protein
MLEPSEDRTGVAFSAEQAKQQQAEVAQRMSR